MMHLFATAFRALSITALVACAHNGSPSPAGGGSTGGSSASSSPAPGQEGGQCGDGTLGTPKIDCAPGLVCQISPPQAPAGAEGSAVGTCRKKS